MGFDESLSQFQMLSELYQQDAPDARLFPEYPSSNSSETNLKNFTKYVIHDPFPPPARSLMKILGPHHLLCGWGNRISVSTELAPPDILIGHWRHHFGESGCPRWTPFAPEFEHITLYPHEAIPASSQVIDPDILHELHSKEVIEKINCRQAAVLNAIQPPCIVKLSHGYAGLGNYFVRSVGDVETTKSKIQSHWPDAKLVINEIIEDIVGDFGVQFYLRRDGTTVWLGFTEQKFNAALKWSGGHFVWKQQNQLYDSFQPIVTATAEYLHRQNYFGVVGVDIVQNKSDEFFLVDVNPRLTGITPFLIASRLFIADGCLTGVYRASFEFPGTVRQLIDAAENCDAGKVLVLAVYRDDSIGKTKCHLSVSGESIDACEAVFDRFVHKSQPEA